MAASHPQASNAATNLSVAAPFLLPSAYVSKYSAAAAFTSALSVDSANATTFSFVCSLNVFCPVNIPKPNSALSSNSELAQAGPCPLAFVVYGVAGADPPQIEEHPVAFAMYILSPNN